MADFITSFTTTTARNNLAGGVGHKFTIGSTSLVVSALGRWVISGNSGTHTLKLVQSTGGTAGTDVTGGSVSVNTSGATAGAYLFANLASSVTLLAGTTYYLFSGETSGGDQWYDFTTAIVVTSDATRVGAGYYLDSAPTTFNTGGSAGDAYGPPNFRYTLAANPKGSTMSLLGVG